MKIPSFVKQTVLAAATCALFGAAPVAQADPLGTTGFVNGSQTFSLSIGGSANAGGFAGTWGSADIIFWCIELTQNFGFGGNYGDYTPTQPGNAKFTLLGQLFHEAYGQATIDEAHSAAFQLAIWEIVYDSGNLNLGGGTFQVLNNYGHAATVALAQSWLTNLSNFTDNYDLIMLSSPSHQDFVTFGRTFIQLQSVPEPASLLLAAAALLAMMLALRSQSRRAYG